jgi:hypothetical protein
MFFFSFSFFDNIIIIYSDSIIIIIKILVNGKNRLFGKQFNSINYIVNYII